MDQGTGEPQGFQVAGETIHPESRDLRAWGWELSDEFLSAMHDMPQAF